tara:strand:+ start:318 stop:530 length:213 start_codon:yes stop_codon:yes gene_type:complete
MTYAASSVVPANQLAGREFTEQYATYDWPLCCVRPVSHAARPVDWPLEDTICTLTADGRATTTLPNESLT